MVLPAAAQAICGLQTSTSFRYTIRMTDIQKPEHRWSHPRLKLVLFFLLAVEAFLLLSERAGWFRFNENEIATMAIAVGAADIVRSYPYCIALSAFFFGGSHAGPFVHGFNSAYELCWWSSHSVRCYAVVKVGGGKCSGNASQFGRSVEDSIAILTGIQPIGGQSTQLGQVLAGSTVRQ